MFATQHMSQHLARISSTHVLTAVTRWPVESQQRARRNAMIASTALAQRRAELDDVEEFLASLNEESAPEVAVRAAHG